MTDSALVVSRAPNRAKRYRLDRVSDESLYAEVKLLAGRHNVLTADLLAHLAEVEARGIHRERACSSLYTYCLYELRFSEDEAQRRARAARAAREFPILFEMLADGAIHLTGLLLLAPYLTRENHADLLARARFRTKRELERMIAEVAPRPDVPARVEPLGPRPLTRVSSWQLFTASLRGPVRELRSGVGRADAPPAVPDDSPVALEDSSAPARSDGQGGPFDSAPRGPLRYRVEFTASEVYVGLLEEARDLLQHQVPNRDIARVHELAMAAFVEMLRKRRQGTTVSSRRADSMQRSVAGGSTEGDQSAPARSGATTDGDAPSDGVEVNRRSAPARIMRRPTSRRARAHSDAIAMVQKKADTVPNRYVPAAVRSAIWQRDQGRCTFTNASGRRCE